MRLFPSGIILLALLLSQPITPSAQTLSSASFALPGLWSSSTSWGDYDGDGDPDLVLTGLTGPADNCVPIARVYRNDNGSLTDIGAGLEGVYLGAAAWGDYDGDGDLDLAVTGLTSEGEGSLSLYENDLGQFSEDLAQSDLTPVRYSALAWGDYDNDGDLDLVVSGMTAAGNTRTNLYRNPRTDRSRIGSPLGGRPLLELDSPNSARLINLNQGSLAWGDYDNDGDLDLALSGIGTAGTRQTALFRNDPDGNLTRDDRNDSVSPVSSGDLAWGDVDNDGDLDLAVSGWSNEWEAVLEIYTNSAGILREDESFSSTRIIGSIAWGDYDNDGDLDLAATGQTSTSDRFAFILRNDASGTLLEDPAQDLTGVRGGDLAWVDVDSDGDLDLILSGEDIDGLRQTSVYTSGGAAVANTPPNPPTRLGTPIVTGSGLSLNWNDGSDAQSSTTTLTYSLRIGTSSGSHNVFSGTSPTGPGNVDDSKTVELSIPLARGTYHWGVRSVDGGFSTSAESQEELFLVEDLVSSLQSIRPLQNSAIAWGDYDNDGDPDLVIAGRDIDGIARALLYRNDAGRLVENSLVGLQGVQDGDLAWGDFDNDGDLDLALTGADASGNRNTHLYRNRLEMNDFALTAASRSDLPQLASSSVAWGDLDNDGDLDLTLMGTGNNVRVAVTYTNDDSDFVEAQTIQPVDNGDLAWGDVDNDEDLDLVTIGQIDNQGGANLVLYRNDSQGALTADTQSSLLGLLASSLALGDYDNDGDLDLAVCGFNFIEGFKTTLYRNDGTGQFSDSGLQFTGVAAGNLAWGDFDNDGDLDLVVVGVDAQSTERALVYRNEGTEFDEISIDILAGIAFATVAWGDLDLDGDLDLASSGRTSLDPSTVIPISRINDNLESRFNPNRSPSAPTGLTASPQGSGVTLGWSGGSDLGFDVTPDEALTYILRVGTEAGGNETASGAAPAGIGRILDPVTNLENLESGRYFWAVRSVDNGFARSEWSGEESFIIDTVSPVVDSVRIRPRVIRAGRRATVVISFTDEPAGMDNAVSPAVSLTISGGERPLPVNQVSFNGDLWLGEVEIVTPTAGGSVVVNVRGAQDLNGNQMAPVEELIAARFAPGAGGIVESQDGLVSLTVSPSVLPETLTESPDVKILPQAVDTPPSGTSAVGQAYEMIADPQFEFRKAATLAIGYAGQSVDENRLAIYQLVGSSWERIGGTVQQELDQVRVPVEQFGTYALFEETGTTGGSASITNVEFSNRAFTPLGGLRALRPGSRPLLGRTDISFNLGAPATVRIEIYNRSGQLQRVLVSGREMGSGRQVVTWNGQDHDDRTVRSGLYIVLIDANGAKAHKTVAVVNN